MRSESTATWTSGEPVSFSVAPYSFISSCLRSAVIVIIFSSRSSDGKVEYTKRSQFPFRELGECHRLAVSGRKEDREPLKIVRLRGIRDPGELLGPDQDWIAAFQANRILPRHGQRRDAVQRGRKGQQVLKSGRTMHKTPQGFQPDRAGNFEISYRETA